MDVVLIMILYHDGTVAVSGCVGFTIFKFLDTPDCRLVPPLLLLLLLLYHHYYYYYYYYSYS